MFREEFGSRRRLLAAAVLVLAGVAGSAGPAAAVGDLFDFDHCTTTYSIAVKTADVSGAGTDANVDVTIKGSAPLYATKTLRLNPRIPGNAFERNQTDTVKYCLDDQPYGYITNVTLVQDGSYAGDAWNVDKVVVTHPNGKTSSFVFDPAATLEENQPQNRDASENVASWDWGWYQVTIKTSDEASGGTDSNIALTMKGTRGATQRTRLNGLLSGNAFERGDTDTVVLWSDSDAGQITEVKLENDGNYAGTDWHVSWVEVTDRTGKAITFKYDRWVNNNSPVDELSSFQPLEAQPEGTQSFQFLTFKSKDNLTNPNEATWSETLEYEVSDAIELSTETGYSVGLSANAGWAASDKGGWEASVGMTYNRFKNDNQSKTQSVQTTGSETIERVVAAHTFMAAKCTWTVPYDMYRVSAGGGTDVRLRVLKGQPSCAESIEVYGAGAALQMSFSTWHAAKVYYGPQQWNDVKRRLDAAGITLMGLQPTGQQANVEFKNHSGQSVVIAFMPAPDTLQFLDELAPGKGQTWGPIPEGMPILFLVGASSAGTYGAPVTGGTEIDAYVVMGDPKQLFVIQ